MKFLLIYSNKNSPSYVYYKKILNSFTKKYFRTNLKTMFYKNFNCKFKYDLIFFMSGCKIECKKALNTKFILIDPRANHFNNLNLYDGYIFNGEEQKLFFNFGKPNFILPVYPIIKPYKKQDNKNKIITFHGDISHFLNFKERFLKIENLLSAKHKNLEFILIYNFKNKKIRREF